MGVIKIETEKSSFCADKMLEEIEACSCIHRIRTLQNLCGSDADPAALLIIPGIDGRNNANSMSLLKYIFGKSVGIELFDSSVIDNSLDEMVLLIQRDSVSAIYSSIAKELCGSVLSRCNLIEYLPFVDEENEIDSQQARKVYDFKRMMLEAVPAGSVIGMSIPIGYDTVQDVESWPLLQSFALDSNICPTGFFSSRYSIVDLSEYLNVIYRGVSENCLDRAITVFRRSIIPHINQSIDLLGSSGGLQRSHTTAGDIAGPLELLCEFGEMVRSNPGCQPLKEVHRPVLLLGPWTSYVGTPEQCPKEWVDQTVGRNKHTIVECSDPSTGLRFCRTYFLETGRVLPSLNLQGDLYEEDQNEETEAADTNNGDLSTERETREDALVLERLKRLYVKLWLSLRATVRVAFQTYTDVLEAGTFIQDAMDSHMKGRSTSSNRGSEGMTRGMDLGLDSVEPYLRDLAMSETERLQVHMDCMNSLGEVISIEDVDEMGGVCWTYVRVSVHGIPLDPCVSGGRTGAVSVGDTFLFSVAKKLNAEQQPLACPMPLALPLLGDSFCVTHAVPYYRCLVGAGREERSARAFLTCIKYSRILQALSLGEPVGAMTSPSSSTSFSMGFESVSTRGGQASTSSSVCILTDHPLIPHMTSKLKLFTGGFVIEESDAASLPILVSFEHHVAELWTIDASECLTIAQARGFIRNPPSDTESEFQGLPAPVAPDGLLIIMRLKQFQDCECDTTIDIDACGVSRVDREAQEDDETDWSRRATGSTSASNANSDTKTDCVLKSMMFNPLKRSLSPFCSPSSFTSTTDIIEPVCVAIFAPRGSKISALLRSPLMTWRSTLRSKGLPEHRGGRGYGDVTGRVDGSVPSSILKAFVAAIDSYSIADCSSHGSGFGGGLESAGTGLEDMLWDESAGASSGTICAAGRELSGLSGTGFLAMRSAHVLSESIRLQFSTAGLQNSLSVCATTANQSNEPLNATRSRKLLIVTGPSGSGVRAVGGLIKGQLTAHADMQKHHIDCAAINLPDIFSSCADDTMTACVLLRTLEDKACEALTQPRGNGFTSSVTIVVVTIAPEFHIAQSDLIKLISSVAQTCSPGVHVSIAAVVAVVAPKSLMSDTTTSPDMTLDSHSSIGSYGFETFRGCVKSLFSVDVCDMAVIVDTPSGPASTGGDSSYSQCRKWIIERNSSVEVVRIKLTSLRLDEDALDRLLSYLKGSGSALSARESSYRARHGPLWASDKVPNVRMSFGPGSSSIPRLRTIRMPVSLLQARPSSASVPASMWSLPSLLSTLQLIFPHATVNCTPCLLVDDWHASSSENSLSASRGFKRLTDLARLKVFSDRRFSEERRIHQLFLSKVKDELEEPKTGCESRKKEAKRMINKLRENIISVLGVISVTSSYSHAAMSLDRDLSYANMSPWNHTKRPPCFVSVEACVGSIILRECGLRNSAHSKGRESETILVVGSFDAQLEEFLSSLFGSCGLLPLQPASDISRTGLTHKVMENIQSKYCGANNSLTPLPSGWWYDGKMYVDIHGYKSEFRPDIDIFLDQYIIEQNNKILNYNELLQFTQSS